MLKISPEAASKAKEFLEQQGLTSPVRVDVANGCGGPGLALMLDEERPGDQSFQQDGVTYVVSDVVLRQTGEISLDYVSSEQGEGFVLSSQNPLAAGDGCSCGSCSCGCG